jgi:MFS family permease
MRPADPSVTSARIDASEAARDPETAACAAARTSLPAGALSAAEPHIGSGFAVIVGSHFLCAFGFSVFSLFPKYLMTARGLSQAETGACTMGFPLGALLFSPLLAWATSRYSKASIVRTGALCFALLTGVFVFAPDVRLIPLLSFLIGGACMGVFNGGAGLTAEVTPERAMARALGLHGAAGMLGHALGPLLIEPLAASAGWTSAFALACASALSAMLLPLPARRPSSGRLQLSWGSLRPLGVLLVVALFAGLMHNALWTSHQPLVLARGGHEMRGYFLGMSAGALTMRVLFGGLPDRLGRARSTLYSLTLYLAATLGMTWVTPAALPAFGLVHGVAHGVFYPSLAALSTSRVAAQARGEALIAVYAAFNVGATLASFGFARFGERFGPAAVFPCAAALGVIGWLTLATHLRARADRLTT